MNKAMKLSNELKWRGFVNQTTLASIEELDKQKFTFYWGVDPSAPSMTVGNLAAAMMAKCFIKHGHKAFLLIGGATGMIGDPDGKKQERQLKTPEEIIRNKYEIIEQYKVIFAGQKFEPVDNWDWFKTINYMEFLRDFGKHVPVRQMLGRDFVQARLKEGGAGISYAEFSYVMIQAYDFYHLHKEKGVNLQICGSDQWGNSIAGVDLIRRITRDETHVWSAPLVINKATGEKFGKSETGAVWLDGSMTTHYQFYQFWMNVDDEAVEGYLKIYTELGRNEIDELMSDFNNDKASRYAQRRLAYEVTKLVHGDDQANRQQRIADAVFDPEMIKSLNDSDWGILEEELPSFEIAESEEIVRYLTLGGLASSNTQARQFIQDGAIYINNTRTLASSGKLLIKKEDTLVGRALIRRGKNTQMVVKVK